jgi:peptide/nickel transport system substrate-binding protein
MGALSERSERRVRGRRAGIRKSLATLCGVAALALVAAACSSSSNTPSSSTSGTKQMGGVATYALPPSTVPNYIFPFTSSQYISIVNDNYFNMLMYRPLYWFGQGTQPVLNAARSVADPPVYNGRQVTITLKGWKWSNGETVDAKDVVFWIHMLQAVGATSWGAYVPGSNGFPTDVSNVKASGALTVTMTMNKSFNPIWFTYNELSQITPMPKAWDRTASGPSDCTDVVADCAKVYAYLDSQSKSMSTWVNSPIWSVVDGPWKLAAFNADGNSTFVPNKAYSGPVKATLAEFKEVPFTTEAAEYNVLQSSANGGSSNKIDFGYLPSTDAPNKPANATVGSNPVNGYTLDPLYTWGINYYVVNFSSTTSSAGIVNQLYFRTALADLMNQKSVIDGPLHGYGYPTVGPVAYYPKTSYLSPQGAAGDPFPYNPTAAKALLTSHGWKVVPNGVSTCQTPSLCGHGIKAGQKLQFNFPYATGTTWIAEEMTQLKSNASLLGISLNLEPKPFNQVTALAAGNCVVAHISCAWDMADWGGGWSFAPDYYPSGETLFESGSGANSGNYVDPTNDNYISQTLTGSGLQPLYTWEDYLAKKLPMMWQPDGVYELSEVVNNLKGAIPQSTTLAINPEEWYFVK